jgi:hypothetical protein
MIQNAFSCVDAIFTTCMPLADGKRIALLTGVREELCQVSYILVYVASLKLMSIVSLVSESVSVTLKFWNRKEWRQNYHAMTNHNRDITGR